MDEAPPAASAPQEVVRVAPGVAIPVDELQWRFTASGGPGGQHANTSNTRVEVRFDAARSPALPAWARDLIVARLGPVVAVSASDERSQARNRALATSRLAARLSGALEVQAPRRATRPTKASQRRRLEEKRRRGTLKRDRREGRGGGEE